MDKSQEILVRFARANYSDGKKCRRPVMCISGVTCPVLKKMTEVTTHIWFREAFTVIESETMLCRHVQDS